jgi:hypothetical protein
MATDLNTPIKTVKQVFAKDGRMDELNFQLATQKALDKVIESAKFDVENKSLNS